jgi:hypothetical protein
MTMAKGKQAEKMDAQTGEVVGEETAALTVAPSTFDPIAALAANSKAILEKAKRAQTAKDEDFRDTEADFWKPEQEGEELRGVYLGTEQGPKYKIHHFGRLDPSTGKPVAVRVNGSTILTRELAKVDVNSGVVIRYEGEGKTDAGNKLQKFIVRVLKD